jgi:hypothetical protein
MIWAAILENQPYVEGQPFRVSRKRGDYGFLQLPSPGDHIQIINEQKKIDLLQVLYVQHDPVPHPDNPHNVGYPKEPFARIIAGQAWRI